jgi:hypothetical protein
VAPPKRIQEIFPQGIRVLLAGKEPKEAPLAPKGQISPGRSKEASDTITVTRFRPYASQVDVTICKPLDIIM